MSETTRVASRRVAELPLIPTTVIGSYPQPSWLIDHDLLVKKGVPRTRAADVWRIPPAELEDALDAATLLAIHDQARAGIDIITDGEIRRESYFNHFANALDGVDRERLGEAVNRVGGRSMVPLVSGPIRRRAPVELAAAEFLRAATDRATKVTVPGPFTLSQLAQNEHYPDQRSLALAYAEAIQEELSDLVAAGIDVVQLDEPYLQANAEGRASLRGRGHRSRPRRHRRHHGAAHLLRLRRVRGRQARRATRSSPSSPSAPPTSWPSSSPNPGSIRLCSHRWPRRRSCSVCSTCRRTEVEPPNVIADRLRAALDVVPPERLVAAPDCGMKFLTRPVAFAKLAALAEGAALVRAEVAAEPRGVLNPSQRGLSVTTAASFTVST